MSIKLFLAAAPLLALAATAQAQDSQSANEALRLYADAAPACVISGATATAAQNATFASTGSSSGTINITQLADLATAQPLASEIALDLPVTCNAAHRLVILSDTGGLLRAGGSAANSLRPNGFADLLPYQLEIDWAGSNRTIESNALGGLNIVEGAAVGALRLRVSTRAGGGALTAGQYDDTITIRFEPAS